jgi:hypothetical protein
MAADIDAHDEHADPERNERYARHLYVKLSKLGFRPLLVTWNTGGYHVWVFFDRGVPGAVLYAFGRWLVKDAKDFGYTEEVETFPKQDHVPDGRCGNWLRVPGRHHTWDVFASVFDGSAWVEDEVAVGHILTLTGDSPDLVPPVCASTPPPTVDDGKNGKKASAFNYLAGADVFAAFNKTVSLDTVVEWHKGQGHRETGRENGRVEFIRNGKEGKGQSFNVQVIGDVPVTYNFSTKAGLPGRIGMSPAQVRCLYETGKCDTATMRDFAKVLRKELGWDAGQGTGTNGDGKHDSPPPKSKPTGQEFPVGLLVVRPGTPRQTAGGKVMVPLTLCRDGKVIDHIQLNDSIAGRRSAAQLIAKHDGAEDKEQVEKVLSGILAWAVEQLDRPKTPAEGDTVRAIVAARVPDMLRFRYRTARGLWTEAEGREMGRAELMAFVPSDLMAAAARGSDVPEDWPGQLRVVKGALEVLWADLRRNLKTAAELKEDTAAKRAFRDAVVRIWKITRTWEVDRAKDRLTASRVSLAGMVERVAHPFVNGTMPPERRGKWRQVREDIDAWWRPSVLEDGVCSVVLAMRYTLAEQVGVTVPEAEDQKQFTELGTSYGVFTDTPCVSGRLTDGTRLSVLTQPVSAEILAHVQDDPAEPPPTDAEHGQ